jgi:hypothetical protein
LEPLPFTEKEGFEPSLQDKLLQVIVDHQRAVTAPGKDPEAR